MAARDGLVIKAGWPRRAECEAAAARFSDRDGRWASEGDLRRRTLASFACFWRSMWPAFLLRPITLRCVRPRSAVRCCCAGMPPLQQPTPRSHSSEPPALLRSETNPAMAHTLAARPRSSREISSPAYHSLAPGHKCPRSRSVSLCCLAGDRCDTRPCLRVMRRGEQIDCLPQQVSLLPTQSAGGSHVGV